MTDEEINIAIAEHCGWEWHHTQLGGCYFSPDKKYTVRRWQDLPCYCTDLNAMHEAENVLTDEQAWKQIQFIVGYEQHAGGFPVLSRSESRKLYFATARQRAEAFLRTIGKLR